MAVLYLLGFGWGQRYKISKDSFHRKWYIEGGIAWSLKGHRRVALRFYSDEKCPQESDNFAVYMPQETCASICKKRKKSPSDYPEISLAHLGVTPVISDPLQVTPDMRQECELFQLGRPADLKCRPGLKRSVRTESQDCPGRGDGTLDRGRSQTALVADRGASPSLFGLVSPGWERISLQSSPGRDEQKPTRLI